MHQFRLALHLTPLSVFWQTTHNVWVWTCIWGVCTMQHIIIFSYGFKLFTTQEKMFREETLADPTGHQKQRTNFFFPASVPSQTWQLRELRDRKANNYLSQVVAVIVGGWMIEQSCVCMCVFETACPFDLALIQTHRETGLCPQTRGLLSPEQAQPITPSKPLQWRQRAAEQDEWLGPGWKPLYQEKEEGWRVCLVVGGEKISKFRCRIQAVFFFFGTDTTFFFVLPFLWFGALLVVLSIKSKQRRHVSGAWCPSGRLGLAKWHSSVPPYLWAGSDLATSTERLYRQVWDCRKTAGVTTLFDFKPNSGSECRFLSPVACVTCRENVWTSLQRLSKLTLSLLQLCLVATDTSEMHICRQTSTLVWRLCLAERWISRQ